MTETLDTTLRLDDPDGVFVALVQAHRDLSPEESRRLDAALVLLLANQIGDRAVIDGAIAAARRAVRAPSEGAEGAGTAP